mgnify:CR=1 FL=1
MAQSSTPEFFSTLRTDFAQRCEQQDPFANVELVDKHAVFSQDEFLHYLNYDCNYKKYKGHNWGYVLNNDPNYFKWVLISCMNVRTKTWQVFAMILTEEQRAQAFTRSKSKKVYKPKPVQFACDAAGIASPVPLCDNTLPAQPTTLTRSVYE